MADKVIVGGPGNSLFRHGSGEKRGSVLRGQQKWKGM